VTQDQLNHAVSEATGETTRMIRNLGFRRVTGSPDDLGPEDLRLVVDCPFCRKPQPYPGLADDGSLPMGECVIRDVYFPFQADEVYAAGDRPRHPTDRD
jgi:hypothetical protein